MESIFSPATLCSQAPSTLAAISIPRLGGNFWDPVTVFAGNMAAGNPTGQGIQEQLDKMVEDITAP